MQDNKSRAMIAPLADIPNFSGLFPEHMLLGTLSPAAAWRPYPATDLAEKRKHPASPKSHQQCRRTARVMPGGNDPSEP